MGRRFVYNDKATARYPNQEETHLLKKRDMEGINKITKDHQGSNVLVVAHGGVINAILSELSEGEIGSGKTELINGGITTIFLKKEKWEITQVNRIEHLSHYNERGNFTPRGI